MSRRIRASTISGYRAANFEQTQQDENQTGVKIVSWVSPGKTLKLTIAAISPPTNKKRIHSHEDLLRQWHTPQGLDSALKQHSPILWAMMENFFSCRAVGVYFTDQQTSRLSVSSENTEKWFRESEVLQALAKPWTSHGNPDWCKHLQRTFSTHSPTATRLMSATYSAVE